ncbi:formyltransferase family protein [Asaia krungthepensis]|uniref:formyltransferase family protein n=1 Tax=Asaia krungthepensis TaxID=220990 RepID=UPI00222E3356|nr:formyltransferase family protein [Asaia krungthepensis]
MRDIVYFGWLPNSIEEVLCRSDCRVRLHVPPTSPPPDTILSQENLLASGIIIISFWYKYKIPEYAGVIIVLNIHPTLLPEGRGRWPIPNLLYNPCAMGGVTIHKATSLFDSGDILIQKKIIKDAYETQDTYLAKCLITVSDLLEKVLADPEYYWNFSTPQSEISTPITETPRFIDISWSGIEIERYARAFGRGTTYLHIGERKIFLDFLLFSRFDHSVAHGVIIGENESTISIALRDGLIVVYKCVFEPQRLIP